MKLMTRTALTCVAVLLLGAASASASASDWPGYLLDPAHSSFDLASRAIGPVQAPALVPAWRHAFRPPAHAGRAAPALYGSPVVYGGSIYIGTNDGFFYRLDERTGAVQGSLDLGIEHACTELPKGDGIGSTATVVADPARGPGAATVYVTAANGSSTGSGGVYLWALDSKTLRPVWATDPVAVDNQTGAYAWASPTVSGGEVFVGIASDCDSPLVRGGEAVVNASNGSPVGTYYTVPAGAIGGSIWSTAAAIGTDAWIDTGNPDESDPSMPRADSYSIVHLRGATPVDKWTVPALTNDDDFGSSPTLFTGASGTPLVGACNKNGTYYAFRRNDLAAGPVWTHLIGVDSSVPPYDACISSAAWDAPARQLIIGGNGTRLDGIDWHGSVRALDTATGRANWEAALPCAVYGTPAENGAGVVAVTTWKSCQSPFVPAVYLFDARAAVPEPFGPPKPLLLKVLPLPQGGFAQPTFAGPYLFVAGTDALRAYRTLAPR